MGFNLGSMIGGAITGGLSAGPIGALAGAVGGGFSGSSINPASDGTLAAQQSLDASFEQAQLGLSAENMHHNLVMQTQKVASP